MKRIFHRALPPAAKLSPTHLPKSLLKDSCQKISLEDLIVCMVEKDLSPLGDGEEFEKQAAWEKIRTQFAVITDERGYMSMWKQYGDLCALKAKIMVIELCLEHMDTIYLPQFGELLAEYGFTYEWVQGTDEYKKQLQAVGTNYKQWVVERELKQIAWDKMEAESEKNKPTREYFEGELLTLSEDRGYHMKTVDVTAFQFLMMVKAFKKKHSKK